MDPRTMDAEALRTMSLEETDATTMRVLALMVGIVVVSVRFDNLRLIRRAIGAPGTAG